MLDIYTSNYSMLPVILSATARQNKPGLDRTTQTTKKLDRLARAHRKIARSIAERIISSSDQTEPV